MDLSSMIIFLATIIVSLFINSLCRCPSIYLRYSKQHSFCMPINESCPIRYSGVNIDDIGTILERHNLYRSIVATGGERRAGGMPTAANMLEMTWDIELQAVAQRRAEQCVYAHDCNNCRRVENFAVGQNIAYREKICWGDEVCSVNTVADWDDVIKDFYEEVQFFDKRYVHSMMFLPGKEIGHFTQMVWANTWRIGCGFVVYKKGNGYRQLYVCNYGPSGNFVNEPLYKVGNVCSFCPINSCCGTSCLDEVYPGLCRVPDDEAPIYPLQGNNLLYCDFSYKTDCRFSVSGQNKWFYVTNLGGSFAEIVLHGGENTTIHYETIIPGNPHLCFVFKYRYGPSVAGQINAGNAVAIFDFVESNARSWRTNLPKPENLEYFQYNFDLSGNLKIKVSVQFSVPHGAPDQFFNLRSISVRKGHCR